MSILLNRRGKLTCGQRSYLSLLLLTGLLALPITACVETGDFGRHKPSIFEGKTVFDFAPDRIASAYTWTDDEAELRNRASLYLKPPRAPLWPSIAFVDDLSGSYFDVYYSRLAGRNDVSPLARYRRLQEDIAADRAGIVPFRRLACRVAGTDRIRQRQIAIGDRADGRLSELDYSDLLIRIGDNTHLVKEVEERFKARLALYRAGLSRLRFSSPDPGEANRTSALLADLEHGIAAPRPCSL